jgi:hypothetical protein
MSILPDRKSTVHDWPEWTDAEVWMLGPEHSEDDERWHADQNEDWHDLDGHPVIDDDTIDDEAAYWADEARRFAADPDDDDIAEADPWTDGDEWEANGRFDDMAGESAYLDAHEQGRKTF